MGKALKISYTGKVTIRNKELSCAVLEDGTRILTNTAVFQAFDRPRKGKPSEEYRLKNVPTFIAANNLKPYIDQEFKDEDFAVQYERSGRIMTGYNAEILPCICNIYLSARDDDVLTENQKPLAVAADILMRSLAKVGIIALIDEATGYQFERDTRALQELFSQYIAEEFLPWVKTFPDEFYIQMFRLRGWDYKGRLKTPYAGQLTSKLTINGNEKYTSLTTGEIYWDKIAKSIKGCDETTLSYFKTLNDGTGTINNPSASVEGLSAYLKKTGQMFNFAAVKATLFNTALNAGIMLAATVAVKLLVQALDNAADSIEDVESRIQNNKTALSDYTSKIDINSKALYKLHYNSVSYRVLLYSKYLIIKGCDINYLEVRLTTITMPLFTYLLTPQTK